MKMIADDGEIFDAHKTKKPRFSFHGGRLWDSFFVTVELHETEIHYDTSWGVNGYFEWQGGWWKISLDTDAMGRALTGSNVSITRCTVQTEVC